LRSAADQLGILASVAFQTAQAEALSQLLRTLASTIEASAPIPIDQNVPAVAADTTTPILVHLSDIHFGSKTAGGKSLQRFFEGENSQSLSAHLRDEFDKVGGHFKVDARRLYLVVSGDLAYRAVKQEFSDAKKLP
jgi:hypothetical protein